jgi:hypothetical protein
MEFLYVRGGGVFVFPTGLPAPAFAEIALCTGSSVPSDPTPPTQIEVRSAHTSL